MEKLIDLFRIYLGSQEVSPTSIKNYLVDLRNFLEWFTLHLKTNKVNFNEDNPASLASLVTKEKIELYKSFLLNNKTPDKTVNRRLSALRKFGSFAVSQGWQKTNPGKFVPNSGIKPRKLEPSTLILNEFKQDLEREEVSKITVKNYLVDTRQFLKFLEAGS